ncbi:MAG: thioesterase family protein [Proteobacteria bacterium]|nr:thioesterase family protein [Pseudomonadota bacterium]
MPEQPLISPKMFKVMSRFIEQGPFHQMLGVRVLSLELDDILIRLDMKEHLVGNEMQGILAGGVISSVLDLVGGVNASIGMALQLKGSPPEVLAARYAKVGTIDLRVDYLKPGRGDHFLASSKLEQAGNVISFARMKLHNDEEQLIAVGSGAYKVG